MQNRRRHENCVDDRELAQRLFQRTENNTVVDLGIMASNKDKVEIIAA
jgi:hypothetical protein